MARCAPCTAATTATGRPILRPRSRNCSPACATTKGRILIDGFSSAVRPLSTAERTAIDAAPAEDDAIAQALALGRREAVRPRLVDAITIPALNVRGLRAGEVGEKAANAVPTQAQASIDFRLVPDLTPAVVRRLVEAHITKQGYHIVHAVARRDHAPDAPSRGVPRMGHRVSRVSRADGSARVARGRGTRRAGGGRAPVVMPNMGGSLPLYLFADILQAPIVSVPVVNHDNNQHAANENLRIQNLWDAIETYAVLVARLEPEWTAAERR